MEGTFCSDSFDVTNLADYLKDKALEEQFNSIRDKDSLESFGVKLNKSFEKFGFFEKGVEQLPTHTIFIGNNQSVSYTNYCRNPNAGDREKYVMKVFKDATKDCEDKETKEIFDMTQDYYSLEKYVYMFFNSLASSGFLDGKVLNKNLMLPGAAVITYVIGVGVTVGNTSAALKAFQHMSASGVAPKSYTYTVLIKGLTADPDYCGDAKKFLFEMMDEGMRVSGPMYVATYTAVIEGFAKQEDKAAEEEVKQVEVMVRKGFVPDAKAMMELLKGKPKPLIRKVINIAY